MSKKRFRILIQKFSPIGPSAIRKTYMFVLKFNFDVLTKNLLKIVTFIELGHGYYKISKINDIPSYHVKLSTRYLKTIIKYRFPIFGVSKYLDICVTNEDKGIEFLSQIGIF